MNVRSAAFGALARDDAPLSRDFAPAADRASAAFYRPELDALRFAAFLSVFLAHAFPRLPERWNAAGIDSATFAKALAAIVNAGNFGVDLFFLLSAYLITELLLRERERFGRVDVVAFYARRALRIWPLYYAFLGVTVFLVPRILPGDYIAPTQLVAHLLFLGNWTAALFNYPTSVAAPLWSVSVEEQFYLCWPLLVARRSRLGIARLSLLMLAIAFAARLVILSFSHEPRHLWTVTLSRLDPIAVGACVAVWLRGSRPQLVAGARAALVVAGLAAWLLASSLFSSGWSQLLAYPLMTGGSLAFLVATLGRSDSVRRSGVQAFVQLGRISYGLYVFHLLALALVWRVLDGDETIPRASDLLLVPTLGLALTVLLAAASYRWIEAPFLRLKSRFTYVTSRPIDPPAP